MSEPVTTLATREDCLTGFTGGAGMGAKMILFANDAALTKNTILADLTEPTFTGYAISTAVTWSVPFNDPLNRTVVAGSSKNFICTGGTPDDTIYGYAIVDSTAMDLLFAERFDAPVPIAAVGDGLTVEPVLPYGA